MLFFVFLVFFQKNKKGTNRLLSIDLEVWFMPA